MVTASKAEGNILDLVLSGTAATSITSTNVYVVINGTAVTEPDSIASNAIGLILKTAEPMDFSHVKYWVSDNSLIFSGISKDMEYSTTLDPTWKEGDGKDLVLPLVPMKVILGKVQPKITKEFVFESGEGPVGITIDLTSIWNLDKLRSN